MRKLCLATTLAVCFLICSNGVLSQTNDSKLDQNALMKKFVGKWQSNVGKDTIEVWECKQYGNAFVHDIYYLIKGKKTPFRINNLTYDSEIGKFKGFQLFYNGWCSTWLGSFTSEKKFSGDFVQNYNPEAIFLKFEFTYETFDSFTLTTFNKDGVKNGDSKFNKVK